MQVHELPPGLSEMEKVVMLLIGKHGFRAEEIALCLGISSDEVRELAMSASEKARKIDQRESFDDRAKRMIEQIRSGSTGQ